MTLEQARMFAKKMREDPEFREMKRHTDKIREREAYKQMIAEALVIPNSALPKPSRGAEIRSLW